MAIERKTIWNVALILFVLSFFVTPLGHYCKILANRAFARSPEVVVEADRRQIVDYDWRLKNADWDFFNFERSKGKVVFINFWATWKLPSEAELKGVEALYEDYGDRVDFYIITNEEREPVERFMRRTGYAFPVTYLIVGDKAALPYEVPSTYLIDRDGRIVIEREGIADWDSKRVRGAIEGLLAE